MRRARARALSYVPKLEHEKTLFLPTLLCEHVPAGQSLTAFGNRPFKDLPHPVAHATLCGMSDLSELRSANLRALSRLRTQRDLWERECRVYVEEARDLGMSWDRIGINLGIPGESLRRRYAPRPSSGTNHS
jgi:hypothetical protein